MRTHRMPIDRYRGLVGTRLNASDKTRFYWPERNRLCEGLAEREELGSNGLLICNPNLARARSTEIQLAH